MRGARAGRLPIGLGPSRAPQAVTKAYPSRRRRAGRFAKRAQVPGGIAGAHWGQTGGGAAYLKATCCKPQIFEFMPWPDYLHSLQHIRCGQQCIA